MWGLGLGQRESGRAANGRYATNNVGTINGAAVPSVGSGMGSFNKDFVSASVIGSNRYSFVQEAMKFFDANGFMITACCNVEVNVEHGADSFE